MTQEQEDVYEAAKLAHQSKNFFQQQYVGSNQRNLNGMMPTTIVDPRHVLNRDFRGNGGNNQNFPQQHPQQHFHQNPGHQQHPGNESGIVAFGENIPENMPAHAPSLLRVPIGKNADGEIVYGDPATSLGPTSPIPQQQGSDGLQTAGFQLPQFGNIPPKGNTSVIDEEKFELLIKEIKSMKKSINKLTKAFEMIKLSMPTTETILIEDSLENTDKS